MPKRKLKIVHIASEIDPFSKTGGLANVIRSLPKAHKRLGHEVMIITPYYYGIIDQKKFNIQEYKSNITINTTHQKTYEVNYFQGESMTDLPVYFVGSEKFFSGKKNLYGSKHENLRFMLFNLGALQLLKELNFKPDIIHCHDWHTGLIPYFLKGRFKNDEFWKNTTIVFTIHNLVFQLGHNWWSIKNGDRDDGRSSLPQTDDPKLENINFSKRAILNADVINTVSETYRDEILTKDFGEDLHRILKNRENRVYGIVNGIDYNEYNPLLDPGLAKHYSDKSINHKKPNKEKLQKILNLKIDHNIPIICMTSRVAEQKGFLLLLDIIKSLMRLNMQLIIMGDGDKTIINSFQKLAKKFPKKLSVIPFNEKIETLVYAGSDMFLLPSRFEPCGINQMIALRYGCIPIVHRIGGLADTITDFNPHNKKGNGFTFRKYNSYDLLIAITRALEINKYPDIWNKLVVLGMQEANSWKIPATKYIELYKEAMDIKAEES